MSGSADTQRPQGSAGLDRAAILRLLPQQGAMCLLESILEWDAQRLLAQGSDPGAAGHPLRAHGRLGSASALEYAAQAAAAHGALLGAASSTDGAAGTAPVAHTALLAAARAVELKCLRLDGCGDALLIEVHRQHAEGDGALYDFELRAGALLARGRLTLLLS